MLAMVESGKLSPELLVGETHPLERAGEVLASMGAYETLGMPVITEF
jgi:alcohol dehydrogenase